MIIKVVQNGDAQAVQIPREFHLEHDEVEIIKQGDLLILRPVKRQSAAVAFDVLMSMDMLERPEITLDERDW